MESIKGYQGAVDVNKDDAHDYREAVEKAATRILEIDESLESLNRERDSLEQKILDLLGTGTTMTFDGGLTVRTPASSNKPRFDVGRLKSDYPDLYTKYLASEYCRAYAKVSSDFSNPKE